MTKPYKNKWISFFNTITELGIDEKHFLKERKKIILFNMSCFVWYFIVLIQIISYFFTTISYTSIIVHLVLMMCIVTTQIIHTKQHFNTARILYLFFLILNILLFSNYYSKGDLTEGYLILTSGITLLYFDNKYINRFVLLFSFLCFSIPNIYFQHYPTIKLYSAGMACLFFSVYMLTSYFKKMNDKNEKLLALERDKVLSDKIVLEKQEAKLRELNQFKTHFFVNLSHEIRTPITLIKGYASKMNYKDSKQEYDQKLSIINNQINQVEEILNSILDLSKLDENKLKLNRTEVSIILFMNKHYANFKELFTRKNINFNLINNIDNLIVTMDDSLISKAINNLLSNALKFTNEFGEVNFKFFKEKDLFIQLTDNGIGIPKEDIDKIFDRFYQSENEITKSQGSGIGLSFTKSILKAHGFYITVESTQKSGTTFTIKIPEKHISINTDLEIDNLPSKDIKTPEVTKKTTLNSSKTETILIVDDHEELRYYLKTVLKEYKILEAKNGIEALNILKNNNIDMVVTDYMMPKMDGKKLVTEIKKAGINIPIIILTARVDDFAKLNMLRIGVDSYLIKPFIEEELLLSVENSLKIYKNILKNQKKLTVEEKEELDTFEAKFHKEIKQFINKNIANSNFGVEDVASFFEISKRTLTRRVKNILGQTTKELIMQARIEKARELKLTNPYMTQKEITKAVGVKNSGHLFERVKHDFPKNNY